MIGSRRERYQKRLLALKQERQSWEPPWRDITEKIVPYRTVWDGQYERNRGDKKDSGILNNRPVLSAKATAAGMMAGITSPVRDWFEMTTSDPDLAEWKPVKVYLEKCKRAVANAFHKSNFYKALSSATYPDLCSIGTSAMFEDEVAGHMDGGVIRFFPMPIGQYYLAVDENEIVDTCFRCFPMTTLQIVKKFGLNRVSPGVKIAYDNGVYEKTWEVVHAVQPNDEYREGAIGSMGREGAHKRYSSCWWEATDKRTDAFLRESGYDEFPILAPRWEVRPGDVYGRGPGWNVRGDCRMLQHHEEALLNMLDRIVKPPMVIQGNVTRMSMRPGEYTQIVGGERAGMAPAQVIPPQALEAIKEHIARTEGRIADGLYANLWQLLINDDRQQRATATEIEAKRMEVMQQLGPLLENLNDELLRRAVERTFAILGRRGMLPPPEEVPEELQGKDIKIEFISIMHQMQKANGLLSVQTLMREVGLIAQLRPDILDKIDADAVADELGRITGVRPGILMSKDEVAKSRQIRAQQEQAKQTGEAMLAATQGVKNLSGADPSKLSDLVRTMAPAAAAQSGAPSALGAA